MQYANQSSLLVQTHTQAAYDERTAAQLTVRKPHSSTGMYYRRRRRKKRIGWDDHFAVPDADGPQNYLEGAGAAVHGDRVRNTAEGRELLLELTAMLPECECPCR